jgi:G:T/U-mismatch repair DNA glycosylase
MPHATWRAQDAYERARRLLTDHLSELHALAGALIERETMSGEQIKELLTDMRKAGTTTTTATLKGTETALGPSTAGAAAAVVAAVVPAGASQLSAVAGKTAAKAKAVAGAGAG